MSRYYITVQVLNAQDYNMRLTVVFLIVTILVCAMIQESEQTFWLFRHGRRHGCHGHRHRRTTMAATTASTTSATSTAATTSMQPSAGRRKREIIAAPLLSALE